MFCLPKTAWPPTCGFQLAERITPDNHKYEMQFVRQKIEDDHPALNIARHVLNLSPKCRDGFINAFVFNCLLRGSQKRQDFNKRTGIPTPFVVLMSPTMRCNLTCEGCYAAEYPSRIVAMSFCEPRSW